MIDLKVMLMKFWVKFVCVIIVIVLIKGYLVLIDDVIVLVQCEIEVGMVQWLIVVNDGCEYVEMLESFVVWQVLMGDWMCVLYCCNVGFSVVCNWGIELVVQIDLGFEVIFLLDVDNMLVEGVGGRMCVLLECYLQVDWFYFDFDFFGQNGYYIIECSYDLLFYVQINFCEVGSLICRCVLDQGICFDENMKCGYEDWDFWFLVVKVGFWGYLVVQLLLFYCKCLVSMFSNLYDVDVELCCYLK